MINALQAITLRIIFSVLLVSFLLCYAGYCFVTGKPIDFE